MLVGQSGGRMALAPGAAFPTGSTQINHYAPVFLSMHFFGSRGKIFPQGKLPKSQKYPMISRLCSRRHEVDKELFFTEQIQHVLAYRTNCRISIASISLLRYVLQLNGAS